jgi:hypothetical protein
VPREDRHRDVRHCEAFDSYSSKRVVGQGEFVEETISIQDEVTAGCTNVNIDELQRTRDESRLRRLPGLLLSGARLRLVRPVDSSTFDISISPSPAPSLLPTAVRIFLASHQVYDRYCTASRRGSDGSPVTICHRRSNVTFSCRPDSVLSLQEDKKGPSLA